MTRVYLPLTVPGLAELLSSGRLSPPLRAHAVTDAARHEWAEGSSQGGGEEEWEYEALCLAADDCRELWGEPRSAGSADDVPRRRLVVAADVASARPEDPQDPTLVVVDEEIPLRHVAAIHADLTEADAAADDDLAWFGVQEADQLLEGR